MRSLFLLPMLLVFSVPAMAESKTYTIDVSAEDYRNYILNGTDRNGSVSGNDPTVTVNKGDTIIFNIDASRHPFYIKTKFSRGSGNQVISGKLSGTLGIQSGKLLRMRGKGFPMLRSSSKGDQIVRVVIDTPSSISRQSKKIIESLKNELSPIKNPFSKIDL